jgi:hypothetical protein
VPGVPLLPAAFVVDHRFQARPTRLIHTTSHALECVVIHSKIPGISHSKPLTKALLQRSKENKKIAEKI